MVGSRANREPRFADTVADIQPTPALPNGLASLDPRSILPLVVIERYDGQCVRRHDDIPLDHRAASLPPALDLAANRAVAHVRPSRAIHELRPEHEMAESTSFRSQVV